MTGFEGSHPTIHGSMYMHGGNEAFWSRDEDGMPTGIGDYLDPSNGREDTAPVVALLEKHVGDLIEFHQTNGDLQAGLEVDLVKAEGWVQTVGREIVEADLRADVLSDPRFQAAVLTRTVVEEAIRRTSESN